MEVINEHLSFLSDIIRWTLLLFVVKTPGDHVDLPYIYIYIYIYKYKYVNVHVHRCLTIG